jgi:hypothetical protein
LSEMKSTSHFGGCGTQMFYTFTNISWGKCVMGGGDQLGLGPWCCSALTVQLEIRLELVWIFT